MSTYKGIGMVNDLPPGCHCVEGASPSFAYTDSVDIETAQVDRFTDKIIPINGLKHPYEFIIASMDDYFTDLSSLFMEVKCKITQANGNAIQADNTNVTIPDNLLSTMWKTVDTKVNDISLHPEAGISHAYRAQMEYLLSIENANQSSYTTSGFGMTQANRTAYLRTVQANSFTLCGPVAADFLRSNNNLAPGNKVSLTFTKNEDDFCLIVTGNNNFKLAIEDICLYVNRIRLRPEIKREVLSNKKQNYLTTSTKLNDYPVAQGLSKYSLKIHNGGKLPHQIVIGFVETNAFNGDKARDPLNFQHFNCNKISIRCNGVKIPQEDLNPEEERNRTFLHLFQNTGKYRVNSGNSITVDSFRANHFLIPFDLSPDQCNNLHSHLSPDGTIELDVGWSQPLAQPISIVVLSIYNQVVHIPGPGQPPQTILY